MVNAMNDAGNRNTRYYRNYGYITTYDNKIQNGHGIIDNIVKGVSSILSSNRTKDVITEGAKAIAKSSGDKLGTKIVEKAFKDKTNKLPNNITNKLPNNKITTNKTSNKTNKSTEQILKEIYGNSILKKQRGKGINKLKSKY